VEKVIFLLPRFKVDRLRQYLAGSTGTADSGLLGRFAVAQQKEPTEPGPLNFSSSLTFALLHYGIDPAEGTFAPITQFTVLAEPFASARRSTLGGPDVEWDYNYYFEFSDPQLQKELINIWSDLFNINSLKEVSKLVEETTKDNSAVQKVLESHTDYRTPPKSDNNVILIRELKHKLFDPNVPSYLLNNQFDLLDWNNAFELVFPTTGFYRHESVKEFLECLVSKDEARLRGAQLIEGGLPRFDMEQLAYRSPKYGDMSFTKIASMVIDPVSGTSTGWIVALNVNQAEKWGEYEQDIRRMNERQALIDEYALCSDRILGQFPGYCDELAKLHATRLESCQNILDLGCGSGILSAVLVDRGKYVTSIDQNDAMLDCSQRAVQRLLQIIFGG
jgi:hypothetical protein